MAAGLAWMPAGFALAQPVPETEPAVRLALVQAIRARMGPEAEVSLETVRIVLPGQARAAVRARVEPGSRLGRAVRFTLFPDAPGAGETRPRGSGYAVATVGVSLPHIRSARDVPRGTILTGADLREIDGAVDGVAVSPLPGLAEIVGARALRDLRAGEVITPSLVRLPPLVRSGETVRTRTIIGSIEVIGTAVARQSGDRHARITLFNPESRRVIAGIVIGLGEVEVIHEF